MLNLKIFRKHNQQNSIINKHKTKKIHRNKLLTIKMHNSLNKIRINKFMKNKVKQMMIMKVIPNNRKSLLTFPNKNHNNK